MENKQNMSQQFMIGSWLVRPELDRIERNGQRITLEPRAMDILVYFSQHPGEVISADELIDNVWVGQIVGDNTVYQWIHKLRKVLGDDTHQPVYIDTITKKGYRLIAEVKSPDAFADGSMARRRRTVIAVLAIVLVALVSIVVVWFLPPEETTPAANQTVDTGLNESHSIAVLPFVDLSPDRGQEYFANGVTEEILDVISGIPELKVVGRSSSFRFRERNADLREIGQQLGVAHILKGSIRRVSGELAVTARLIRAEDGVEIWSRDYDKGAGQIFAIQHEIAVNIARKLRLSVVGGDYLDARSPGTSSVRLDAHDLFLLARQYIHKGGQDNLERAVAQLEQALAIDANFAQAHAELAYAYIAQARLNWRQIRRMRLDGPAMRHAEIAISIDPGIADAHAVRGMVLQVVANNEASPGINDEYVVLRQQSEQAYQRALEINPNSARTHIWYAELKRDQNRPWSEQQVQGRRAIELDPLWPRALRFYLHLISPMLDYQAEKWVIIDKLKELSEDTDQTKIIQAEADVLLGEGRIAEALLLYEEVIDLGTADSEWLAINTSWIWAMLGEIKHRSPGKFDDFSAWMNETLKVSENDAKETPCPGSEVPKEMHPWNSSTCVVTLLMGGQTEAAARLLINAVPDGGLEDFDLVFRLTYQWFGNAAISMATILQMQGETEKAMEYARIYDDWWSAATDDGIVAIRGYAASQAMLHALQGNHEQALTELRKVIETGDLDFRIFMHPVFNEIRHDPEYRIILEYWIGLINKERTKLDLQPLELNDDVGPGVPPFKLIHRTL